MANDSIFVLTFMNVFVTGGTGLLGAHLLFHLSCTDSRIKAIRRKHSNLENVKKVFSYYTKDVEEHFSRIHWLEGDLLNKEFIDSSTVEADVIFHLAAFISYRAGRNVKKKMFETNILTTKFLLEACKKNNIGKFCYVSSTSTLGSRSQGGLITEESNLELSKHTTSYARSKFISEGLVVNAGKMGLKTVIVNPSIILGPGDWSRSSSKMILNIYNGLRFYPNGIIGFVDVRDVVTIMILLVNKEVFGEKFIVSSQNLSYKEVFIQIARNLQIDTKFIPASNILLAIKWRIEHVKSLILKSEPLITKETVSFSRQNVLFSNEKIVKELNFSFKPISDTIDYCTTKFIGDITG